MCPLLLMSKGNKQNPAMHIYIFMIMKSQEWNGTFRVPMCKTKNLWSVILSPLQQLPSLCHPNLGYGTEDDILHHVSYSGRIFYVYILFYNL